MNNDKQEMVMSIIGCGKYRFDHATGLLESFRVGDSCWRVVKGNKLPNGYVQYILFGGRGTGSKVIVYGHVLSWMFAHGVYDDSLVINHKNGVRDDNRLVNLEAVSVRDNVMHSYKNNVIDKVGSSYNKLIRYNEIVQIKEKIALGWSSARIARELGLNRVPVTRIVKKIRNGEPLKFEIPGPYKSNNAEYYKLKNRIDEANQIPILAYDKCKL